MTERPLPVTDSELPWDLLRPQAGEIALRSLHAAIAGDAPEEKTRSVNLLTQIARAEAMQGKLVEAERTLDRAAKLVSTIEGDEPRLRLLLERGRLFSLKRTLVQARECFLEVWNVARERGLMFHAIDAAQMMAVVETPKLRSKWTVLALEVAGESKDPRVRGWLGQLYISLGTHYEQLLQLTNAVECFEWAVSAFEGAGSTQEEWLARSHVGRVYRIMKRVDEALKIQQEVVQKLGKHSPHLAMAFEEMGECLLVLKRAPEAEECFKRVYELVKGDDRYEFEEPSRFKRLKTLAKIKG